MDTPKNNPRIAKYKEARSNIPALGCGNNCHTYLLSVANYARMAGIPQERAFTDIEESIPPGKRPVSNREIEDALRLAYESDTSSCMPKPKPFISDESIVLHKLIEQRAGISDADILEVSPVHIDWPSEQDATHALSALYKPDDLLFIGEREQPGIMGRTIRTCSEWLEYFSKGGATAPHIVPNPLTGNPAPKKNGNGLTCRGDGNIAAFRFCVVEFDNLSREEQLAFWAVIDLPIVALIDSGGKSPHAWIDVRKLADVTSPVAWEHHIKGRLYSQHLIPLGVDSACSNPSRLSRLPGHFREDKGRLQQILFLSPEGRRVF